jgi:hypothetical protein
MAWGTWYCAGLYPGKPLPNPIPFPFPCVLGVSTRALFFAFWASRSAMWNLSSEERRRYNRIIREFGQWDKFGQVSGWAPQLLWQPGCIQAIQMDALQLGQVQ